MKNSVLIILLITFSISLLDAADLKVYPNALSPDFASIQDAIDAAEDGDNIYIDTAIFIGNVSINSKAISLYPMRADGMYTINGSLSIYIENDETVYIQGLSGGSCIVSHTGTGGTSTNEEWTRKIIFNGCYFSSFVQVNNLITSEVYYSEFNNHLSVFDCELIANTFNRVSISSGTNIGKTKIYANRFESNSNSDMLYIYTNRDVQIANNYMNQLNTSYTNSYDLIEYTAQNAEIELLVENNTFNIANGTHFEYSYSGASFGGSDNNYRPFQFTRGIVTVRNNYMHFRQNYYSNYEYYYAQGIYCDQVSVYYFGHNLISLFNYDENTITNLENGGYMGSGTIQTIENNYYQYPEISTDPLTLGYITSESNLGHTDAACRDIDNTVNDIGTYGGPHSWENYHSNSDSKAQILDLEIPYYQVILPGVELQFNSKAIHKN